MRMTVVLFVAALLISSNAWAGDRCTVWMGGDAGIYIRICEYESGGSGYVQFKNTKYKDARISYVLIFNNGKRSKGSTPIKARSETGGASCYSCARQNSGVRQWAITKIRFRGEAGYW